MKVQMSSGVDRAPALLPVGGVAAGAAGGEVLERDRVLAGAGHPDHLLELRQLVADLADLLQLLVVLDDDDLGVGVLEHVLALLGGVGLVDRDDDGADRERGEVEVGPLGAGVAEDRDLVALLDAEVDQAERERPDRLHDLAEAAVDPALAVLVADRRARRRTSPPRAAAGPRACSIWFPAPPSRGSLVQRSGVARRPRRAFRAGAIASVPQRGLEEGPVDSAVEDRDAHLHAFADHLLPFHLQLLGKLGGVR